MEEKPKRPWYVVRWWVVLLILLPALADFFWAFIEFYIRRKP